MAGIGFRLRSLIKQDSFSGLLQAYGFAGIISSGPWVLSILGILVIGVINTDKSIPPFVEEFQISVTYLMAFSLLLTSPLQLLFTRFISDRIYEKKENLVLPNLLGALILVITISGIVSGAVLVLFFSGSLVYRLLMLTGFVILSATWILIIILSGLKAHRGILLAFAIGYGITVSLATQLKTLGLEGLMAGFVFGHGVLFFILLNLVLRSYSSTKLIAFDFLQKKQVFISLIFTGFFYNLAIWADKFIFWFTPQTSKMIIEPLRASEVYDLPIFLAYLSIIPGMAVFLIRMETDFAEKYQQFYSAINQGKPLKRINQIHTDMTSIIRHGIHEVFKVQGMTVIILMTIGTKLLAWFGISPLYRLLFNVDLIAVGVQVLLLAILNLLFYFDYRVVALNLCVLFALSNIAFTSLTIFLGPAFYGYGFATAVILTTLTGFIQVSQRLERLPYETFMLRQKPQ